MKLFKPLKLFRVLNLSAHRDAADVMLIISASEANFRKLTIFGLIRAQAHEVYGPQFSDAILEKVRGEVCSTFMLRHWPCTWITSFIVCDRLRVRISWLWLYFPSIHVNDYLAWARENMGFLQSKGFKKGGSSCRPNRVSHFRLSWWCTQLGVAPDLVLGATFWSYSMWVIQRLSRHINCLQLLRNWHSLGTLFERTRAALESWMRLRTRISFSVQAILMVDFWPLQDAYPEVYRFTQSIFPSADDDVITSPYNRSYHLIKLVMAYVYCGGYIKFINCCQLSIVDTLKWTK